VKVIVGLGNPGRDYEMTRHNVGFLVLDELAGRHGLKFRKNWLIPAQIARGVIGGEAVRLVKPMTYMNRSGLAVGPVLRKVKAGPEDLILVFDDVALDRGQLRIRAQGSAGGHNGVQSVINMLGGSGFSRIRVGIGRKPDKLSLSDYVLGPFSEEEKGGLKDLVRRAADAAEAVCSTGVVQAMNCFN
jgi:PTH1 family peptidyl-tRNA hydrolase